MNYTERLMKEIERVTLRGSPDKETVRSLAAIIFDMEQRVKALEVLCPTEELFLGLIALGQIGDGAVFIPEIEMVEFVA